MIKNAVKVIPPKQVYERKIGETKFIVTSYTNLKTNETISKSIERMIKKDIENQIRIQDKGTKRRVHRAICTLRISEKPRR